MNRHMQSCLSIIRQCDLQIDKKILKSFTQDENAFFSYLFAHLSRNDLDKLIIHLFYEKNFTSILTTYFPYLSTHISSNICSLLFEYLVDHQVNPAILLESIQLQTTNLEQYKRITSFLNKKVPSYKIAFQKENRILYELKDRIETKNIYEGMRFEELVIFPISREKGNEYLTYIFNKIPINLNHLELISNGIGTFSWSFKADDFVLKLSSRNTTWYLPMFYRINDFIIRRSFGKNIISVSPYGDIDSVTNQDILDALSDFDKANLNLTDGNYLNNFAVVDYEIPDTMFRDVCGIKTYLDIPQSDSYQKKKVKLIDQDFIYFKDDKEQKRGAPPKFK